MLDYQTKHPFYYIYIYFFMVCSIVCQCFSFVLRTSCICPSPGLREQSVVQSVQQFSRVGTSPHVFHVFQPMNKWCQWMLMDVCDVSHWCQVFHIEFTKMFVISIRRTSSWSVNASGGSWFEQCYLTGSQLRDGHHGMNAQEAQQLWLIVWMVANSCSIW